MIIQEKIKIEEQDFIRTYSNANKYIQKIGTDEIYEDAIDLPNKNYQYEETNKEIVKEGIDRQ